MVEVRKIYADLVTSDGTVCVVYLAWARVLGSWHGRAGVEIYPPDGTRQVWRAPAPPVLPHDVPLAAIPFRLDLEGAGRRVELHLASASGGGQPDPPPAPSLAWRVAAARTEARLSFSDGREIAGTGYVDVVRIGRSLRRIGLRRLQWGRIHLDDGRTAVFDLIDLRDGSRWRWGALGGRTLHESRQVAVELDTSGAGRITIAGDAFASTPVRTLHHGSALDPERMPLVLDRLATRILGGRMHETRWLGRATAGTTSGWLLHERVDFG